MRQGACQPKVDIYDEEDDFGFRFNSILYQTYDWCEFSLSTNRVFCFCCPLFDPCAATASAVDSSQDVWLSPSKGVVLHKNLPLDLYHHEHSARHKSSYLIWQAQIPDDDEGGPGLVKDENGFTTSSTLASKRLKKFNDVDSKENDEQNRSFVCCSISGVSAVDSASNKCYLVDPAHRNCIQNMSEIQKDNAIKTMLEVGPLQSPIPVR